MSKIYKALEKAEKDRGRESRKEIYHPSVPDEAKMEKQEMRPTPLRAGGMVSDQPLISIFQPKSLAAEQFRKLRTYLLQFGIQGSPKTIMVTSATEGEGKTFVAANLAGGMAADLHAHALLVECDLRSPVLADLFDLPGGSGLSDYLRGDRNISDLLMKTEVEKLSILPGGSIPDNPTELIGSKKMEALVHELKSRYSDRYVIFDSPPLLATSEPEVLSKLVDGMIIVVRAGVTPRETIKQAISSVEKGKILGFVLNDLNFKSSGLSSRYFGSDGYYYGYGYGKSKTQPQSRWRKLLKRKSDES
jgi:exopolysaccharide/PEP-CTERM locus tyrosine autokinase